MRSWRSAGGGFRSINVSQVDNSPDRMMKLGSKCATMSADFIHSAPSFRNIGMKGIGRTQATDFGSIVGHFFARLGEKMTYKGYETRGLRTSYPFHIYVAK
jgi:hypothetical protein